MSEEDKFTGMQGSQPIWLSGLSHPETWLLPPRRPESVFVIDMGDPHEADDADRDRRVRCLSLMLTDHLWAHTDAFARPVVFVRLKGKEVGFGEALSYEGLGPYLASHEPPWTVVWGRAARDVHRYGFDMSARSSASGLEPKWSGQFSELAEQLVRWLVDNDLCQTTQPPSWYRAPADDRLPVYREALLGLLRQVLANTDNRLIPPLTSRDHRRTVECALRLVQNDSEPSQAQMLLMAAAIHAHRASELAPRMRKQILKLLNRAPPQTPMGLLAPRVVRVLGGPVPMQPTRRQASYRGSGRAHDAWLARVEQAE